MIDIQDYFRQYEWSAERLDTDVWRATFSIETEEDFDLFCMVDEQWTHFALSPFMAPPQPECSTQLHTTLLRLNQQMQQAYFAVDNDGDVNLLAEVATSELTYDRFASTLDALTHYAQTMIRDLGRVGRETGYRSRLL